MFDEKETEKKYVKNQIEQLNFPPKTATFPSLLSCCIFFILFLLIFTNYVLIDLNQVSNIHNILFSLPTSDCKPG